MSYTPEATSDSPRTFPERLNGNLRDVKLSTAVSIANSDSPYTANAGDNASTGTYTDTILADSSAGSITINLVAVATELDGRLLRVVKTASANTVTIDGDGSETINGATTKVLSSQYSTVLLLNTGTEWLVLSEV